MSIAKSGSLPESYRYYTLCIKSFDNRLLMGQVYHDSLGQGIQFGCLSEMAFILESMFDKLQYPMQSVDLRSFDEKPTHGMAEGLPFRYVDGDGPGKLGEFRLHVKHRFNATWQGDIKDIRSGKARPFSSFLELMDYLNTALGQGEGGSPAGLGKRMCEVAVRSYGDFIMGGDISHPAVEGRHAFCNEFDIKESVMRLLTPLPEEAKEGEMIIPRTMTAAPGAFGPATFVVRILFRRNATWQGSICWKERRCQVSFRSFLELLLLMQDALLHREGQMG